MKDKWEKEFDQVMSKWQSDNGLVVGDGFSSLKAFIRQLLISQKERMVKAIGEMRMVEDLDITDEAYNQALDDITKLLEKNK